MFATQCNPVLREAWSGLQHRWSQLRQCKLTDECVEIQGEHREDVNPTLEDGRESNIEEHRCRQGRDNTTQISDSKKHVRGPFNQCSHGIV